MRAFVIKNKEGKYFTGFDISSVAHFDTYDICDCFIKPVLYKCDKYTFEEIQTVPAFKDCEVVEITIKETKEKYFIRDITIEQLRLENEELEQELAVYKKALELALSKLYGAEYIALYKNNFIEQAKESINDTK